MEALLGKQRLHIDTSAFRQMVNGYQSVLLDLGTGDGRFARSAAETHPDTFVIGLDACRENLLASSKRAPPNSIFLVANAERLPEALSGLAGWITINFPWGSLLEGLLLADSAVLQGLERIARPGALLEVRLNAGALAAAGCGLEQGAQQLRWALSRAAFSAGPPLMLDAAALRACPSTWARRLAFGRDPRGMYLRCRYQYAGSAAAGLPGSYKSEALA